MHPVCPFESSDKEVRIGVEAVQEVSGEGPSKCSLKGITHRRVTESGREQFACEQYLYSRNLGRLQLWPDTSMARHINGKLNSEIYLYATVANSLRMEGSTSGLYTWEQKEGCEPKTNLFGNFLSKHIHTNAVLLIWKKDMSTVSVESRSPRALWPSTTGRYSLQLFWIFSRKGSRYL